MKSTMRLLSMAALALAGAVMAACAGSDDTVADTPKQPENTGKVITLKTTVGLGGGAAGETTRALTANGVKTFAVGEKMALLYTNTSGQTVVVPSEALTDDDIVITGNPDTDKKSATFTFNLTEAPDKTKDVKYFYPAAMATNSTVNYNRLYSQQDGTLTKLASDFDAASSDYLAWAGGNLPGADLENRLAILAITLKDDVTGADITSSITSLILSVVDGSYTYNVSRSAAAGPIYVAIRRTAYEGHNSGSDINVTASDGIFTYTKTLQRKKYYTGNFYNVSWRMTPPPNAVPLTVEALTAGTIVVNKPRSGMQYSKNGGEKTAVTSDAIDVSKGDKVQFYGNGTSINSYYVSDNDYTSIAGGTAQVKVYGNIMSLVNEDGFATATKLTNLKTFQQLFYYNTALTDASGLLLPATTLADNCYSSMFSGCSSLTTAPALPAEKLANRCYQSMFTGCSSLTTAPAELPATTLVQYCYASMFRDCSSLETAPALPAETLVQYCYDAMFSGCSSLTAAPVLPATTLAPSCYMQMFYGCTSLSAVTCLATNISAHWCTLEWLSNAGTQVTGTKTFTKNPSMTSWPTGSRGIPSGWTVEDYVAPSN